MPNRIVREGILTSERVNALGWAEEVFYRRLMSVADDYGRYYAHPSLIRAACYPLHLDKVSDSDIDKWITACVNADLVRVYRAEDRKRYLEIQDFGQRQQAKSKFPDPGNENPTVDHGEPRCASGVEKRERYLEIQDFGQRQQAKSKFSSPDNDLDDSTVDHGEPREKTALVVVGVEDVDREAAQPASPSAPPPKPAKSNRGTRIPDDWQPTPEERRWAEDERPDLGIGLEIEKFRDYWRAKTGQGATKRDWSATWRNWVRNANTRGHRVAEEKPRARRML